MGYSLHQYKHLFCVEGCPFSNFYGDSLMKLGIGKLLLIAMAMTALAVGNSRPLQAAPTLEFKVGSNAAFTATLTFNATENQYEFFSGLNNVSATGLVTNGSGLFTIDVIVKSNAPGSSTLGELMTVTTDARRSGMGGSNPLFITVADSTFNNPVGANLQLQSTFTGTGPGSTTLSSAVLVGGSPVAEINGQSLGASATPVVFSNNTTPFTLRNVTYVDLNPNGTAMTTGTTRVVADTPVVPEPSTIAMALTALVPLGFAGLRRFRRRPDVTSV
jgi:hypothetical protein